MSEVPEIKFPAYLVDHAYDGWKLRIVLEERTELGPFAGDPIRKKDQLELLSREVIPASADRRFAISCKVVACAMRGDAYPHTANTKEDRTTIRLINSDTAFMQFVRATCITGDAYMNTVAGNTPPASGAPPVKPLQHWRVVCNEATFDLASVGPPTVEKLPA